MSDEEVSHEEFGEEYDEEYRSEESAEAESVLTEYDPEELVSGAVVSPESTIPIDLFELQDSLGYDSLKAGNLCVVSDDVICWCAGSVIVFMDVEQRDRWLQRSTTGGTVTCLAAYREEPNYRLAVGEARSGGRGARVVIYLWPLQPDAVLRHDEDITALDFSRDGSLLASAGARGNLTVWRWQKRRVLLRASRAAVPETVVFSEHVDDFITTAGESDGSVSRGASNTSRVIVIVAGAAHIQFWKMADTFTGLKLKGELGRFGKTEICDIIGVYPMPDAKVLSGSTWGNILVWEASLVKLEVTRRGRKPCHKGPVVQLMINSAGEVISAGMDGHVCTWYWETVHTADPPEDDAFVELNPVAEISIPGCQMMCLKHDKNNHWYVQDGAGGVWHLHLEEGERRRVLCAGGAVVGGAVGRAGWLAVALRSGTVRVLGGDGSQSAARRLSPEIRTVLYVPAAVEMLLLGFSDGTLRIVTIDAERAAESKAELNAEDTEGVGADPDGIIKVANIVKPHSMALTHVCLNSSGSLLLTAGEDRTVFVYRVRCLPALEPLCYTRTPATVTHASWRPASEDTVLLCMAGGLLEARLATEPSDPESYEAEFRSVRETPIKKYRVRHRPPPVKDEDDFLTESGESEEEAEEEEEHLGEVELVEDEEAAAAAQCVVSWAAYAADGDSVWVTLSGVGALLLVRPRTREVLRFMPLPSEEAWNDDITARMFLCDDRYLLTGSATGDIRVMLIPRPKPKQEDIVVKPGAPEIEPIPRLDCEDHYWLPMHDGSRGAIRCFAFAHTGRRLYTCGDDGNIFSYKVNFPETLVTEPASAVASAPAAAEEAVEPEGEPPSHEERRRRELAEMRLAAADAHKRRARSTLAELAVEYRQLTLAERALPASLRTAARPTPPRPARGPPVRLAHLLEAAALGLRKMADRNVAPVEVFPFALARITDPSVILRPLRQKSLSRTFYEQLEEVRREMSDAAARERAAVAPERAAREDRSVHRRVAEAASFLNVLPARLPHALSKAVRRYRERLRRHRRQTTERSELAAAQEAADGGRAESAAVLRAAREGLGARALRTEPQYQAPPHRVPYRLCETRRRIFENKHLFNAKVVALRDEKVRSAEEVRKIRERLAEIRVEIPAESARAPPSVPDVRDETEFPEKNLEVRPEPVRVPVKGEQTKRDPRSSAFPRPRTKQRRVPRFVSAFDSRPPAAGWDVLRPRNDRPHSALELEIRERRIQRHLYEQDALLQEADTLVRKFDHKVEQLMKERIRVQEMNVSLELHQIQLHRELDVINRFAGHEGRLQLRVHEKSTQIREVQDEVAACQSAISELVVRKNASDAACQELQKQFRRMITDNKFSDFLRRIFKKKYRPPRGRDDEESSEEESSSSSSEEEEDQESLDSRDIGPIRLDPNICPEGCDRAIYDKTYELRNIRHEHEQEALELDRRVELIKKEIEMHNKEIRKVAAQLDQRRVELKEFMVEKQSRLNEIEQVVILRYDQIRADSLNTADVLVFPEATLCALRARVLELHAEIAQQRERHRVSRRHERRLCTDLRALEERRLRLAEDTRGVLRQKLGRTRGRAHRLLDDVLRLEVTRFKNTPALDQLREQLAAWKRRRLALEKKYIGVLEKHSSRLRVAASIQTELIPPTAEGAGAKTRRSLSSFRRDAVRLRLVRQLQLSQIQSLEEEIRMLKMKSDVVPAPSCSPSDTGRPRDSTPPLASADAHEYFPIEPTLGERGSSSTPLMDVLTELVTRVLVGRGERPVDDGERPVDDGERHGVREDVTALLEYLAAVNDRAERRHGGPEEVSAATIDDAVNAPHGRGRTVSDVDVDALIEDIMAASEIEGDRGVEYRQLTELVARIMKSSRAERDSEREETFAADGPS